MKKFRRIMLVLLMVTGGYTVTAPVVNAGIVSAGAAIVKGLGKLIKISEKTAKNAAMLKVVKEILDGTGKLDDKLKDLNGVCGPMREDMGNLWNATNTFYNDLKVLSREVQGYRDMLNFVGSTRDIQGYCGAAINLTSRNQYLSLADYEYILRTAVGIQEYSLNHLQDLYRLLTKDNALKMNDFERMRVLKELSDEQEEVLKASKNLVVYVKQLELKNKSKAEDDAFRKSFLNMRF